jgi:hypothetical protein
MGPRVDPRRLAVDSSDGSKGRPKEARGGRQGT